MPEPKRPPLKDWLGEMGACRRALKWAGARNDLGKAWRETPRWKATCTNYGNDLGLAWLDWLWAVCRDGAENRSPYPYLSIGDVKRRHLPALVTDAWDAYCYARWMADHA